MKLKAPPRPKPKSEQESITLSIRHWKRMIDFVHTMRIPMCDLKCIMESTLDETWGGDFCALCTWQTWKHRHELLSMRDICSDCPLATIEGPCGFGGQWTKVVFATSRKQWLIHARKLLKQLESLVKEVK